MDRAHGEKVNESVLDDYMAQYQDAWEEPWWDELVGEREEAFAEEAATLEHYSNSNEVIQQHVREAEELSNKYPVNSVVSIVENGKSKRYQIVAQKYNEKTGTLVFGLHQVTKKNTLYKNNKVIWVDKSDISNYNIVPVQLNVDFG